MNAHGRLMKLLLLLIGVLIGDVTIVDTIRRCWLLECRRTIEAWSLVRPRLPGIVIALLLIVVVVVVLRIGAFITTLVEMLVF